MNREEIDELLKKPVCERRAMAYGQEVTVMTWHGDSTDHVAGCFGRFDVAERKMGVWGIASLSPIDPPKPEPKRVRFNIANRDSWPENDEKWNRPHLGTVHECNLDDCYTPGDDLCSFKEMADAGVYIRASGNKEYVVMVRECNACWCPDVETPDWNTARCRASKLTRQRKGE